MDIERLNKSQIVLLTLLVSFVTSIATGIVTVTLMEQAPPAITQTVNRIVERTVEKVIQEPVSQPAAAATVVTEKTIIVKETDLIEKAVARVTPSLVRLYTTGIDESGKPITLFVGFGIVLDESGTLLADSGTPSGSLTAERHDGVSVRVSPLAAGLGTMRLQAATTTGTSTILWQPALFSKAKARLGESVVALGGRTTTRLAAGIVTAISEPGSNDTKGLFETNIPNDAFSAGSPLLTIDGEIIGIATRVSREAGSAFLASSNALLDNDGIAREETSPTTHP